MPDGTQQLQPHAGLPSPTRVVVQRTPTGPASVVAVAALYELTARALEAVFDEPVIPTISGLLTRLDTRAVVRAVSPLWRSPVVWVGASASVALAAAVLRRSRPVRR